MEYLFVAIGGALGSITRFIIGRKIAERARTNLFLVIFIINITGAIFLGIISSIELYGNVYFLVGDGFLGAYTTFSTFMYDGFIIFKENKKSSAAIYIFSTIIIGVIGYIGGMELVNLFKDYL